MAGQEQLWELNSGVGIHTNKKVGITTDLPRVELEVGNIGEIGTAVIINGDLRVGIVTIGVVELHMDLMELVAL